jgi:hypothetical protein
MLSRILTVEQKTESAFIFRCLSASDNFPAGHESGNADLNVLDADFDQAVQRV